MNARIVVAVLALAAPAAGQEQETFKAQTDRERAHEARLAQWWGQGNKLVPGVGTTMAAGAYPLVVRGTTREQMLVCLVDTIAIVTVVESRPVLSQQENFIYTEYDLGVIDSIKGHLFEGKHATITQIGGQIDLPSGRLAFYVGSSPPLRVGATYLAFLDRLSYGDDFSPRAMFEMEPGGTLHEMYQGIPAMSVRRSNEAMARVRAWECAR